MQRLPFGTRSQFQLEILQGADLEKPLGFVVSFGLQNGQFDDICGIIFAKVKASVKEP